MKRILAFGTILGVTLSTNLNGVLAQTKVTPKKLLQFQSSPSLTEPDVKKLIQEEIEKGGAIRDRVQTDVNRTFGWTTSLLQFQIAVLAILPIVVALLSWSLRNAIQKQLVEESKKQVKEQLDSLIQAEIQEKVSSLEKEINDSRQKVQSLINYFEQEVKQSIQKLSIPTQLPHPKPRSISENYLENQSPSSPPPAIISELPPQIQIPQSSKLNSGRIIEVTAGSLQELLQKIEAIEKTDPSFQLSYEDYLRLGNGFYLEQDFEKAIDLYDKALALKPNAVEALLTKSATLALIGKYEHAMSINSRVLEIKPDSAEAWHNQGYILEEIGKLEEALAAFEKSLELKSSAEMWDARGRVLYRLEKSEKALAAFEKAIELKQDFIDAWLNKGTVLNRLGQYSEAIFAYEKAIELNPDFANAWYNKGNTLDKLEKIEEAIAAYEKAIDLKPDFVEAWCNKGLMLRKINRLESALNSLEKALEYNPNLIEALSSKAYVLSQLERYEESIPAFDNAIRFNPNDVAQLYFCKGLALKELGRCEDALYAWYKAIKFNPNFLEAQSCKGLLHLNLQQYDEAISSFSEAIRIDQNSAIDWYNRACGFSLKNEIDMAINDLIQSIKINPDFRDKAKLEPDFDLIRSDDRFVKLIEGA
jgi:tetratricopeptide (TPR) repeat protein